MAAGMRHPLFLPAIAASIGLVGCISAPPPPPPRPAPVVVPAPPPPPKPVYEGDWRDWPLTPGDWTYRPAAGGSMALYGVAGVEPVLTIRCDGAGKSIVLTRRGSAPPAASMTVRTTSVTRALSMTIDGGMVAVRLPARDPLLDAIGFSRGRFVIEQPSLPTLVVPAWPEISRVIEDCRR